MAAMSGAWPAHERLGPDDCENLRIDGNPPYSWIKNQRSWFVSRTHAAYASRHSTDVEEPRSQLQAAISTWRGQDGQNETQQPDHSASLGDSITSSSRMGFSVHTARAEHFPEEREVD
jgi:hypothetical protein